MGYDKIILGAGLYGLYAAVSSGKKGESVLVLEKDAKPFSRATTINQARVHMGYHYPRSLSTALRSAGYFERFINDYSSCIVGEFEKIYATSSSFSWTGAEEFRRFCRAANIMCDDVSPDKYFNPGMCSGAFITTEYAYDANKLLAQLQSELDKLPKVEIRFNAAADTIEKTENSFLVKTITGDVFETPYLLNATYASVNEIMTKLDYEPFNIKYELCELILCNVSEALKSKGITVMDGPFFSIMPFGNTGMHSLTSVTFTPHISSYDKLPTFNCQAFSSGKCSPENLDNCDDCFAKPKTAWAPMNQLARKYLKEEFGFNYQRSLFSMKPILKASEIDDSRPTLVRVLSKEPTFVSVLSGKINTVYDLDDVL